MQCLYTAPLSLPINWIKLDFKRNNLPFSVAHPTSLNCIIFFGVSISHLNLNISIQAFSYHTIRCQIPGLWDPMWHNIVPAMLQSSIWPILPFRLGGMAYCISPLIITILANWGNLWAHVCRKGQCFCLSLLPCQWCCMSSSQSCRGWLLIFQRKQMFSPPGLLLVGW